MHCLRCPRAFISVWQDQCVGSVGACSLPAGQPSSDGREPGSQALFFPSAGSLRSPRCCCPACPLISSLTCGQSCRVPSGIRCASSFCLTCFYLLQGAVTGLPAGHVKLSLASLRRCGEGQGDHSQHPRHSVCQCLRGDGQCSQLLLGLVLSNEGMGKRRRRREGGRRRKWRRVTSIDYP